MKVIYDQLKDSCTISPEGVITVSSLNGFKTSLKTVIYEKGIKDVTVDLKDVKYVDSATLGVIVESYKTLLKKGGLLKIKNPNQTILKIFTITRLDRVLTIIH